MGQGHSGFSHGYFCNLLIPLLKGMPITPLTGRDWEWNNRYGLLGKGTWQNRRCPRVFKKGDQAYNCQGRAFSNDGEVWYTSMNSRKEITFPCSMKDLETERVIIGGEDDVE